MPVRDKLYNLLKFVSENEQAFVGLTCKNHDLIPQGCDLDEDTILVANLEPQVELKEFIEVAERRSLKELKDFLRRCIDVIEFLFYIREEVDKQKRQFSDLIRQLDPVVRDALSK